MKASASKAAAWAEGVFREHGIQLTLGGEPTYVPIDPVGAEWSHSAVGPTKLGYAWRMAEALRRRKLPGSATFFSPGKQYPGEVNPRWALRMVARRDGKPIFGREVQTGGVRVERAEQFLGQVLAGVGVAKEWMRFKDPTPESGDVWVLPLDWEDGKWLAVRWKLARTKRVLLNAEGPAGLRLPLHQLTERTVKRALVVELIEDTLRIFFPPLVQGGFTALLGLVSESLEVADVERFELQGYVPRDEAGEWVVLGLAADPGVLEINVPPCTKWAEYNDWLGVLGEAAESVGLRSIKTPAGDYAGGTGGGNHLLWGGPTIDENPFFTRPGWLAAILRYWQKHPSLAYLFTGVYVGASSQAPRPDESAKELFDLEMAYRFLESLGEGDHRAVMNETLRHLHSDVTGNAHRSEISFDKFWNPGWPGGVLGLIEFRAIESLPEARWMSAVALLWVCLAALNAKSPAEAPLRDFSGRIQDRYFLPSCLWADLMEIISDLRVAGCPIDDVEFRKIWDWRFECLLEHEGDYGARLQVRRAHESWPLLCETPVEGGATSRFVDTSMHRIELKANAAFVDQFEVRVTGRPIGFAEVDGVGWLSGLRYRRSSLYPCLHPGIEPHLPLDLAIISKSDGLVAKSYSMDYGATHFSETPPVSHPKSRRACRTLFPGAITHDLRLE